MQQVDAGVFRAAVERECGGSRRRHQEAQEEGEEEEDVEKDADFVEQILMVSVF